MRAILQGIATAHPTIARVDTHRIGLAISQLRNADEQYRMRLTSRAEDEDAFAQAGDELLRSVSTAVLVIGEELSRPPGTGATSNGDG